MKAADLVVAGPAPGQNSRSSRTIQVPDGRFMRGELHSSLGGRKAYLNFELKDHGRPKAARLWRVLDFKIQIRSGQPSDEWGRVAWSARIFKVMPSSAPMRFSARLPYGWREMASFGHKSDLSSGPNSRTLIAAQGHRKSHVQILPEAAGRHRRPSVARDSAASRRERARVAIAVIDFDYQDTAGEPRDQIEAHRTRLNNFMTRMRSDLAASEKYRVVSINCPAPPCTAGQMVPAELIAAAKRAGARLILYGGIHKMSTLVQLAKVQVVDIEADRLIDNRSLTFRGDTDEAWQKAEAFIVEELKNPHFAE